MERGRIVVVTAVRAETRAVLGSLSRVTRTAEPGVGRTWSGRVGDRAVAVVEAGIGPIRAAAAVRATIDAGDVVVSTGFAGALAGDDAPGGLVLPATILWDGALGLDRYDVARGLLDAAEDALAASRLRRAIPGALFSSPTVIASLAAKRDTATRTGAVAVEMEAAGIIAAAREHDVPVLALRVLLDGADVSLEHVPPDLDSSWRARGRLVARPAAWAGVLALARHVPGATRALGRALRVVLPVIAR